MPDGLKDLLVVLFTSLAAGFFFWCCCQTLDRQSVETVEVGGFEVGSRYASNMAP